MIVRYPAAVKAGAVNDTPGYFADWFPTLTAACGIETPSGLDGENLWPVITGSAVMSERKPMVWVYPEYGGQVAVRIGDFKVLRRDLKKKKPGSWEVYDLSKDISEEYNLAPERPELIQRAEKIFSQQMSPNDKFPIRIPAAESAAVNQ
jgi:arylsulfatase A-like enzyme